jgi:hypothetical protein
MKELMLVVFNVVGVVCFLGAIFDTNELKEKEDESFLSVFLLVTYLVGSFLIFYQVHMINSLTLLMVFDIIVIGLFAVFYLKLEREFVVKMTVTIVIHAFLYVAVLVGIADENIVIGKEEIDRIFIRWSQFYLFVAVSFSFLLFLFFIERVSELFRK